MANRGPWENECDCEEDLMCSKHRAAIPMLEALERMVDRFAECAPDETRHLLEACAGCNARAALALARGGENG